MVQLVLASNAKIIIIHSLLLLENIVYYGVKAVSLDWNHGNVLPLSQKPTLKNNPTSTSKAY